MLLFLGQRSHRPPPLPSPVPNPEGTRTPINYPSLLLSMIPSHFKSQYSVFLLKMKPKHEEPKPWKGRSTVLNWNVFLFFFVSWVIPFECIVHLWGTLHRLETFETCSLCYNMQFPIMIGSPRTYLSHLVSDHGDVQLQICNYNLHHITRTLYYSY